MSIRDAVSAFFHDGFIAAKPRPFAIATQGAFALVLLIADIAYFLDGDSHNSVACMAVGVVLLGLATLLAVFEWKLPRAAQSVLIIALLDFIALGLSRFGALPEGAALSPLVFFPATWLMLTYKWRGLWASVALVICSITIPSVFASTFGFDPAQLIVVAVLPLTVLVVGGLLLGMDARLRALLAEQSRLTEESQHSRELLRRTLNNIDIAINLIDASGETIVRNEAGDRLVKQYATNTDGSLRAIASIGGYMPDGVTPYKLSQNPIRRAMRGETVRNQLILVGDPTGPQKAFSVSAYPLRDEGQLQGHLIVVAADVTAMQQLLRQRDEFVAGLSSEVRAPLNSILGYVDITQDEVEQLREATASMTHDELSGAVRETPVPNYLDVVQRNAEQVLKLIDDLLLEQQARRGQLHISRREFELVGFSRRVMESLRTAAALRGTKLRLVAPDELLSNAIQYGGEQGLAEVLLEGNPTGVTLRVVDHGPGMPPDELSQLFVPFIRGSQSGDGGERGSGVGLSLVDRIVSAHGGTIRATSEVGVGTTMTVWLPRAQVDATD
jgi:signal transduction histidine kinase